jgi:sugar phosphate isomerase/epimerase
MGLDEVLKAYSSIGYRHIEVFTSWTKSAFDIDGDPDFYLEKGRQYGLTFPSMHMPSFDGEDLEESLATAVKAARFAEAVGSSIVICTASDRPTYIRAMPRFLEMVDHRGVTAVIQNHVGSPLSTPEHMVDVLTTVNDPRLKTVLEVGHLHAAGFPWRKGYDAFGELVTLVHIKDHVGEQSVPFGTGEIDLPGLFAHMESMGYTGNYVIEMEVADHENTLQYIEDALTYMRQFFGEG